MFLPTKEELEELGFEIWEHGYAKFATSLTFITFTRNSWLIWTKPMEYMWESGNRFRNIYPKSIEDIKTLITLLTPHEN